MIESIHIQNFRCFEDFKLQDFGRVNLIGGMNNAGKTALLEGIFVGGRQNPHAIHKLKEFRYGMDDVWKNESEKYFWNDLFFALDTKKVIYFQCNYEGETHFGTRFTTDDRWGQQQTRFSLFRESEEKATVEMSLIENNRLKVDTRPLIDDVRRKTDPVEYQIYMLSSALYFKYRESLVKQFSKLELIGKSKLVLNGLQAIDSSIKEVKVMIVNEPNLYVKRDGEGLMPINFFGDAITKLTVLVLSIIAADGRILLIDEIENGIHYTNQPKVWETIFKLAEEFNVQIFATTHSKEMATAFAEAAEKSGKKEEAKYIEMARHYKTNKIVGLTYGIDRLQYKLERNEPFRGE